MQEQDLSAHCNGCGRSMCLQPPVELDVWLAAARAFALLHASHGRSAYPHTCVLTGAAGENADDCTTHQHE